MRAGTVRHAIGSKDTQHVKIHIRHDTTYLFKSQEDGLQSNSSVVLILLSKRLPYDTPRYQQLSKIQTILGVRMQADLQKLRDAGVGPIELDKQDQERQRIDKREGGHDRLWGTRTGTGSRGFRDGYKATCCSQPRSMRAGDCTRKR